jgi:hypothetical protein
MYHPGHLETSTFTTACKNGPVPRKPEPFWKITYYGKKITS